MKKMLLLSVIVSSVALAGTQEKVGRYFTDAEYRKEAQAFAKKHGFEIPEMQPNQMKSYDDHTSSTHGSTPEIKKVSYNDDSMMHALPYTKGEMHSLPYYEPKKEMSIMPFEEPKKDVRALPVEEQGSTVITSDQGVIGYQALTPDQGGIGYQAADPNQGVIGYPAESEIRPIRQMDTDYMTPVDKPVRAMDTDYMGPIEKPVKQLDTDYMSPVVR